MEKANIINQDSEINMDTVKRFINGLDKVTDISKETDQILSMTPRDGYHKKIDLIANADDMTTQEKIKAIDAAEDKFASDLKREAEVCSDMIWVKVGATLICVAGIVVLASSPVGGHIVDNMFKSIA